MLIFLCTIIVTWALLERFFLYRLSHLHARCLNTLTSRSISVLFVLLHVAPGGGGGGHSTLIWTTPRAAGGLKTGPCLKPLGALKIHPVTIYLTKNFHMHTLYRYGRTLYSAVYHHTFIQICCVPHARSLVPRSRACHKHCGLCAFTSRRGSVFCVLLCCNHRLHVSSFRQVFFI